MSELKAFFCFVGAGAFIAIQVALVMASLDLDDRLRKSESQIARLVKYAGWTRRDEDKEITDE